MKQEVGNPERDTIHQNRPVAAVRRLDGVPQPERFLDGLPAVAASLPVRGNAFRHFSISRLAGGDVAEGLAKAFRKLFGQATFAASGTAIKYDPT
jgi:hypothetical protein